MNKQEDYTEQDFREEDYDNVDIDDAAAQAELKKGYDAAQEIINNKDKFERFLQQLESKLKVIPKVGGTLSEIPVLISLVKSYVKKEYTDLPLGTIIAIVSALIYFLSPVDLIPDSIPFFGFMDDAAVVAVCLKLVKSDVDAYQKWRVANDKVIDFDK